MTHFTPRQRSGSEFGGVDETYATLQPTYDVLSNADKLRLEYLTGVDNTESFEDRRQMLGLRPATGARPLWLDHVSPSEVPHLGSEARRQGYGSDEGPIVTSDPDMPLNNEE